MNNAALFLAMCQRSIQKAVLCELQHARCAEHTVFDIAHVRPRISAIPWANTYPHKPKRNN